VPPRLATSFRISSSTSRACRASSARSSDTAILPPSTNTSGVAASLPCARPKASPTPRLLRPSTMPISWSVAPQ